MAVKRISFFPEFLMLYEVYSKVMVLSKNIFFVYRGTTVRSLSQGLSANFALCP